MQDNFFTSFLIDRTTGKTVSIVEIFDSVNGPGADSKVKVTTNDTTTDFLTNKLSAGTNVTLNILNPGANEQIEIVAEATPAGADTEIQFNDSGSFGASSDFTYDGSLLNVNASATVSGTFNDAEIGEDNNNYFFSNNRTVGTGSDNVKIGLNALSGLTTGFDNISIGRETGLSLTSGANNISIGRGANRTIVGTSSNICIGRDALQVGTGTQNNITGGNTFESLVVGDLNTVHGHATGAFQTGGSDNVYLGAEIAPTATGTCNRNILIGKGVDVPAASTDDFLNIGTTVFGDLANNKIAIGGTDDTINEKLHVRVSGTSGFSLASEDGILITDDTAPRIVFEDTGETLDDKVIGILNEDQLLKFIAYNDTGASIVTDNLLVMNRIGNVDIGTDTCDHRLHVVTEGTTPTPGWTFTPDRGIMISDDNGPRMMFDDTGEPLNNRIMVQRWEGGIFSFNIINDSGSAFTTEDLLTIEGQGNVSVTKGTFGTERGRTKSAASFSTSTSTNSLGNREIYYVNSISGDITLTISTSTINTGTATTPFVFLVKDITGDLVSNGFTITLDTEGSQTIDGATSIDITADYGVVRLFADGSNVYTL